MTVFELFGKLSLDSNGFEEGIDGASKKTSMFAEMLKANLASDAIMSGMKKIAGAVVDIGKSAFNSYADYEQLVGGAELMFGDAYDFIAQKAKKAYSTVQMSQNDYLKQVNGFATGLKTALGGNVQAAAELADRIITAEADVVAATGNTQESVQNAFNGIMKSNYTMLDNLQLGITPTKEGFQQLINTVNEWNAANGKATDYTIDNLADCQSALVDYIEMQGLAGYAANEAADTIQGSTASMKAAWENLATGMADDNANMEELVQDFVDSVFTAGKNIVPRVEQIVTGVGTATVEAVSYLRETNSAIDLVITAIEDLGIAAGAAGVVIAGSIISGAVKSIATVYTANAAALAFFTAESGKAAVAQAVLDGEFAVSEVLIGVLTGQISLATAAQYAWNAAMSLNPIGVMTVAVGAAAVGIKKLYDAGKQQTKELAGNNETVQDAANRYKELKQQLAELESAPGGWTYERTAQIHGLKQAIKEVEDQIIEFGQAEAQAAEEAAQPANRLKEATEGYYTTVNDIINQTAATYDTIVQNASNWFGAFEQVTDSAVVKVSDMKAGLQSQIEYFQNYTENIKILTEAGATGLVGVLATMGSEGAGAAQSLVDEINAAGGITSEKTQAMIQDFESLIATRDQALDEFGSSMALGVNDTINQIGQVTESYIAEIKEWDKSGDATQSAINTMQGLASGLNSGSGQVMSTLRSIGNQMTSALQSGIGTVYINVEVTGPGAKYATRINGSNKDGLDYVPFDGYISELHKGEAVLTAAEARAWRAGKAVGASPGGGDTESSTGSSKGRGMTLIQNIQAIAQTPVELAAATEAYFTQARWAM